MKSFPQQWQEPWAITGEGGAKLLQAWAARDFLIAAHSVRRELPAALAGSEALRKNDGRARVMNGVAVIPVYGALFRHADVMETLCGGRSYESLLADVEAAKLAPNVRRIVLDIDSPGGEANGCFETSEAIARADKVKPIEAFIGGYGASAAWALACGARRRTAHASSFPGCIGVRLVLVDSSKFDEAVGLRYVELVSKRAPDKRGLDVDDALIARLQSRIDGLEDEFIKLVASSLGVTPKKVAEDFGRGDVVMGRQALEVGMVEELGSLDDVLAQLQRDASGSQQNGSTARVARMTTKEKSMLTTGNPGATMGDAKCDGCGKEMAGSDAIYCTTCKDAAGEDAKALGLPATATATERRARMTVLVALEQTVLTTTSASSSAAAVGALAAMAESHRALPSVRADLVRLQGEGVKRDLRSALEAGVASKKLSPGRIISGVAVVLRGETRTAWDKAMEAVAKKEVTTEAVIGAACTVATMTSDDVSAINEYVKNADPVAATTSTPPPRNPEGESAELDAVAAQVKKFADEARASLDKNAAATAAKK